MSDSKLSEEHPNGLPIVAISTLLHIPEQDLQDFFRGVTISAVNSAGEGLIPWPDIEVAKDHYPDSSYLD